jgi:hypothetical protein
MNTFQLIPYHVSENIGKKSEKRVACASLNGSYSALFGYAGSIHRYLRLVGMLPDQDGQA